MKRQILTATVAALALTATAAPLLAQNGRACGPRPMVIDRLAEAYGETRRSIGLGTNNQVVEVFASETTGSWTITVTMPNGMTCLVATGQSYETLTQAENLSDDPAL